MAPQKKAAKNSFYQVVFQGKPKVVRAFMAGVVMGGGLDARVFYSFLEGIHHDGVGRALAEKVGFRAADVHVIVDGQTSALLKKLTHRLEQEAGLVITSHRFIRRATMDFRFHTFAPRYHEQIIRHFRKLPDGLVLKGYDVKVDRDPDAKGVEMYSSVHEFESGGRGVVSGSIDALVAFKAGCAEFPLVETDDIELVLA